jgi:hypothetical protein
VRGAHRPALVFLISTSSIPTIPLKKGRTSVPHDECAITNSDVTRYNHREPTMLELLPLHLPLHLPSHLERLQVAKQLLHIVNSARAARSGACLQTLLQLKVELLSSGHRGIRDSFIPDLECP